MSTAFSKSYIIINESFEYNGNDYNVALTPELYFEDDGLDFTGQYHCIVISSHRGTSVFDLIPDDAVRWVSEPKGVDPGLIDKLAEIITAHRKGDYHKF